MTVIWHFLQSERKWVWTKSDIVVWRACSVSLNVFIKTHNNILYNFKINRMSNIWTRHGPKEYPLVIKCLTERNYHSRVVVWIRFRYIIRRDDRNEHEENKLIFHVYYISLLDAKRHVVVLHEDNIIIIQNNSTPCKNITSIILIMHYCNLLLSIDLDFNYILYRIKNKSINTTMDCCKCRWFKFIFRFHSKKSWKCLEH